MPEPVSLRPDARARSRQYGRGCRGRALRRLRAATRDPAARAPQPAGAGRRRSRGRDCDDRRAQPRRSARAFRHDPADASSERLLHLHRIRCQLPAPQARRSARPALLHLRCLDRHPAERRRRRRGPGARTRASPRCSRRLGHAHRRPGDRPRLCAALRAGGRHRRGDGRRRRRDGRYRLRRARRCSSCDTVAGARQRRSSRGGPQRHRRASSIRPRALSKNTSPSRRSWRHPARIPRRMFS